MKKFLTPEWIRFIIYVIGLFAVGIIAVTNTNVPKVEKNTLRGGF